MVYCSGLLQRDISPCYAMGEGRVSEVPIRWLKVERCFGAIGAVSVYLRLEIKERARARESYLAKGDTASHVAKIS